MEETEQMAHPTREEAAEGRRDSVETAEMGRYLLAGLVARVETIRVPLGAETVELEETTIRPVRMEQTTVVVEGAQGITTRREY